jgi:hypothetical protein
MANVSMRQIGWAYGMMGFFCIAAFGCLVVLMWKGHAIRERSVFHTTTEEGERVLKHSESVDSMPVA